MSVEHELADFLRDEVEAEALKNVPEPVGMSLDGDAGVLTSRPRLGQPGELDIPGLLAEHGLSEADWIVERSTVNRWEQHSNLVGVVMLRQFKLFLTRRQSYALILPKPEPRTPYVYPPLLPSERPKLILLTSDVQAPFHEERLHELTLRFAEDVQPDEWVDLGDLVDLDALSRFRKKPNFVSTVQEGIDTAARILWERRQAAGPACRLKLIEGNHDERLQTYLLDHAEPLYGLKRAQIGPKEHESVLDIGYLLRLDELGVELVRSQYGGYPHSEVELAPNLIGVHGDRVRTGAGNSVRAAMKTRHMSVIQGHVNKLSLHSEVRHTRNGAETLWGCEAGMLGRIDGGMGFAGNAPDWQQGFITIAVFPDGAFQIELVPYVAGGISWRGRRWQLPKHA